MEVHTLGSMSLLAPTGSYSLRQQEIIQFLHRGDAHSFLSPLVWDCGGTGGGRTKQACLSDSERDPSQSPQKLGKLIDSFEPRRVHPKPGLTQSQGNEHMLPLSVPLTEPVSLSHLDRGTT